MPNVKELLQNYRDGAAGTGDPVAKVANKWQKKMHACYKILRETEEGRNGIIALMTDDDCGVRVWAAAHSLRWASELARQTLEQLRDSGGERSFEAEMTLKQFDKGCLSFD